MTTDTHARFVWWTLPAIGMLLAPAAAVRAAVDVDMSGYSIDSGVMVTHRAEKLTVRWPIFKGHRGQVVLNLDGNRPLFEQLGVSRDEQREASAILRQVDPLFFLTVGNRRTPPAKPPDQKWQVFFDKPAKRPHETFLSKLDLRSAKVTSRGRRATVILDDLTIGSFAGRLELTFYANCPLVQVQAVVRTLQDGRAIIYDAGLVGDDPGWRHMVWMDTEGHIRREAVQADTENRDLAVRHRALIAEGAGGCVACFPPPHQFQFPRDWTNNFGYVWYGANHLALAQQCGFGIRQDKEGGGAFVPWFNAAPQVWHRLSVFYLLAPLPAEEALTETLRLTHGDRFPKLPGRLTMTSHWHMAVAVTAMEQQQQGIDPLPIPDFARMFKDMGVNMVHLAEFHGDGHQKDDGPLRLAELASMFSECRRLSDDELLVIPGEEVNTFLGLPQPGKHPGHWMSLFPKPVYWIMQRQADQPFVEHHLQHGNVYRVGGRADMIRLLKEERGLAWSAHPRIKASSWTPDIFRHEDFFLAEFWLGGAWKALPADLSWPRLGQPPLQLLDDMANWGNRKYLLGEVDVFKLDHTHELYGHMNINYVELDRLPRFDDGWQAVLDALRGGKFFVTTGEVLIPFFSLGGKTSGQTVKRTKDGKYPLRVDLTWTFPLAFVEIISGDGHRVYRQRIDLGDTTAHGARSLDLSPDLSNRHWVRVEAWDVAANGAFTQPIWLAGD